MAEDRWLRWQAEMAGTADGPSIGTVLATFAAGVALLLALLGGPAATGDRSPATGPRQLSPACAELQRLARHGVRSGASWRRAWTACEDPTAALRAVTHRGR
jgi:hypothetical protein